MFEQQASHFSPQSRQNGHYLCLHGHFYQPPREDPFTGLIPIEPSAGPFANYNERITFECYRPNAELGNFTAMSFNFGPTLLAWLERSHSDVYQRIIASDHAHLQRYGVGNALAQVYNHTILPLATCADKRTQIRWGLRDFLQRYGHPAQGMWLAETAVDLETLELLADEGVLYTILAPWQAARPIDTNQPYRIRLPHGKSITVFFYNSLLSGGVSFNDHMTSNADEFVSSVVMSQLNAQKSFDREAQLIMVATDGELYGHHKPWRDKFLAYLLTSGAECHGMEICTPGRYLQLFPPTHEVELYTPSAWSCSHGLARWSTGCSCTEGDSSWKSALLSALTNINGKASQLFEQTAGELVADPWLMRDEYLALHYGWEEPALFWDRHCKKNTLVTQEQIWRLRMLLEAQFYHQYSFTSCAFFFEDLNRIEPRNAIAFARRAISLTWQALGIDLQSDFVQDLASAHSWQTGLSGADLYRRLPIVDEGLLPRA
ncbi:DUF3536 domain-containing protein [Tengunoibacter tsumagoiensis]|uniref:Glycoside hydrolase family 57 N-terminal domain-containing protein n=1 Tax=Tengunoibacter tsumagoiensis TaxID=2014871 RepID=A0A401ZUW4_9CHLR|nr:DUF3536 domain-containing protein [Tengunoibacter tsumagoiensis]GCE10673.1 hypothetical protein KTT_05320 [Tengunoibacter tsumagoiensis]